MPKTILAVFAIGLPLLAQNATPRLDCNDRGYHNDRLISHCEMKEQTFATARGAMHIDPGMNGGVSVNGWDRNEVWVRARIETNAETDSEARSMVSAIRFASGAEEIRGEGPTRDRNHNWSVSYEIFAPRQADIDIKTFNGGVPIYADGSNLKH